MIDRLIPQSSGPNIELEKGHLVNWTAVISFVATDSVEDNLITLNQTRLADRANQNESRSKTPGIQEQQICLTF